MNEPLYIPIRSDRVADLSAALHELKRPPYVRDDRDVARYLFAWFDHPSGNGWSVLKMPAETEVPVHVVADGELLAETLSVFLADGRITQEEFDGLLAAVPMFAGQSVRIADLIPPSWQGQVLDEAGARAAGFLPPTETEELNP
jgi:hypothetical protein